MYSPFIQANNHSNTRKTKEHRIFLSGFGYFICDWNQIHNLFYSIPKNKWQCIVATKIFRNLFLKCHMVNTNWWWNMMFEIPRSKLLNMDWKFCKHTKHQFKYDILLFVLLFLFCIIHLLLGKEGQLHTQRTGQSTEIIFLIHQSSAKFLL